MAPPKVPAAEEPGGGQSPAEEPVAAESPAEQPAAAESPEKEPDAAELKRRVDLLKDIGDWKRTIFKIPVRRLTAQEWTEELLLAQAKEDFLKFKPITFDSPRGESAPAKPGVVSDPLDRVRVTATLVMVGALFAIVAVIVFRRTTPSGIYQLVSLASGLAGIGLGWLFGAARGKKSPLRDDESTDSDRVG